MPAPVKAQLAELTKTFFRAKMIPLPMDWASPGVQYPDAFEVAELAVAPNPPTNLFREVSFNKYHVDTAGDIGKDFETYIDGISDAICDAIDKWMKLAMFTSAIITGPVGIVTPGSVMGPSLTPFILAKGPQSTPMELKYTTAIAQAFGINWQAWHMGMMGTLMYPAFAAFPGPMGPPTPNVPMPLITFPSGTESMLSPSTNKATMVGFFADPDAPHADDLFDSIAQAFFVVFQTFKVSTMVTNVLGMGPIPTFAPPVVPVGPVVGGTVIPKPGVFT